MRQSIRDGFDRTAAPGSNRDLRLFGEAFGSDLVAEAAHDIAARADKDNSHLLAEVSEGCVFCHEAPAHPDCVGVRFRQNLFETLVVEVAALGMQRVAIQGLGGAERKRLVGFADEHGMAVGFGEERNGAQRHAVLRAELTGSMDEAHRGLAAVHNRNPSKVIHHKDPGSSSCGLLGRAHHATRTASPDMISCSVFRCCCVHGIRERDGLVAREAQDAVPFRIDDIHIETFLLGVGSEHRVQLAVGCGRRTVERNLANMLGQAHAALHTEFPDASGLETQLNQARLHDGAAVQRADGWEADCSPSIR